MLNYMEASYEKNHTIDATAQGYWNALRTEQALQLQSRQLLLQLI